ncbi:MAG: hypothetical protein KC431_25610, partial [Myxococcales bacterium]|nr:hypothetical protein [Myxococcales bacterium]
NAFLDALALTRRAQGSPALSVGWCPWLGTGLAATSGGERAIQAFARAGAGSIDAERALALLDLMMADAELPAAVAVAPAIEEAPEESTDPASPNPRLLELRALSPATRRKAALGRLVLDEAAVVLGTTAARVDPQRPLRDQGMDSLMAVELVERLARLLGLTLEPTSTWRHPTVQALSELLFVQAELDDEPKAPETETADTDALERLVDGLSDEEAQALLAALD